jgi:Glycosyltransferase family 87
LLAALLAASLWFYVQRVLVPFQQADAASHGRPRGMLSDLYPRWLGARELLLHHRDPYSDDVTREIQAGYYGRPLDAARAGDPRDEERFAYPVYVAFLLAPTVSLPFPAVRDAFRWLLAIVTAASVVLWLRVLVWRPSPNGFAILLLLTLGSYCTVQGIKLEQLSLLVCGVIAASAVLLVSGQLFLAGVLLAVATIKPQLVVLLTVWLMLWTLSRWRERQGFFWGFTLSCGLLAGGGEYVLPGWIERFAHAVTAYLDYTDAGSPLEALTTHPIGKLLGILLIAGVAVICWRLRHSPEDSRDFRLVLALMLTTTLAVVPMLAPYNQLLLLPAVFLIAQSWKQLWQKSRGSQAACSAAAAFVLWPWMVSLGLMLASLFLTPATIERAWALPLWSSPAIPIAILGPLAFQFSDSRAFRARPS